MKKNRILNYVGAFMVLMLAIASVLAYHRIRKFDVLPNKYLILLLLGLTLMLAVITAAQFVRKMNIVGDIVALILIVVLFFAGKAVTKTQKTIEDISEGSETVDITMEVLVLNTSSANGAADVARDVIAICKSPDTYENSISVAKKISSAAGGIDITTAEFSDEYSMARALLEGSVGAMIVSSQKMTMVEEAFESIEEGEEGFLGLSEDGSRIAFSDKAKIIENYTLTVLVEQDDKNSKPAKSQEKSEIIDTSVQPFIAYLSGIDDWGDVATKVSRSDVNLIACVNPQTKQIAVITTPRDSFVKIPGKTDNTPYYDKLTHAGFYSGSDCSYSIAALEWLYGIDIDYYLRVNYTSIIDIVEAIGGININNKYEFDSKNIKGYHFDQGWIFLTGLEALIYCRERYSFADGDYQRGRNQIEVVKGIVNSLVRPQNLTQYDHLLDILKDSMVTNMQLEEITKLVKMQLSDGATWNILSYSTAGINGGTQQLRYTLAAPSTKLYVTVLDEGSVKGACRLMEMVLNGQTVTQEQVDELAKNSIIQ